MQLVQALAQAPVTAYPLAQLREFGQSRVRPAASVKQAIDLVHDGTQDAQLGLTARQTTQGGPLGDGQVVTDEQVPPLEQSRRALPKSPGPATQALRFRGVPRTAARQLRSLGRQPLAQTSQYVQHRPGQFLEDVELADLMRNSPKNQGNGHRVEWGAIGGDTQDRVTAGDDLLVESRQKPETVCLRRVVIKDLVEQPSLLAGIDGRQNPEGAGIQLIGRQIAGEVCQGPIEVVGLSAGSTFFPPPPRSSFGAWERGRKPDGPARGATKQPGRADRLPPPAGSPGR